MRKSEATLVEGCRVFVWEHLHPRCDVFFLHGLPLSSGIFGKQFESHLFDECRLISVDLPGHGESPPAADPMAIYSLPSLGRLVAAIAHQVCRNPVIYVGHSLGGHLLLEGFEGLYSPAGIVLSGNAPLGTQVDFAQCYHTDLPAFGALFQEVYDEEAVEAICRVLFAPDYPTPQDVKEMVRSSDGGLRTGILDMSEEDRTPRDEVAVASSLSIPLAILQGEQDQSTRLDYLRLLQLPTLWRGEIQIIPGAGHCPQWEKADDYNNLLSAFIRKALPTLS